MDKSERGWVREMKVWIKQKKAQAESCDQEILSYKKEIKCINKQIELEKAHKKIILENMNEGIRGLNKVTRG